MTIFNPMLSISLICTTSVTVQFKYDVLYIRYGEVGEIASELADEYLAGVRECV